MTKAKPWLLLALVFFAGIAVGVVGARMTARKVVSNAARNPDWFRERMEQELTSKLDLKSEQRAKVSEILTRSHAQMRELRSEVQPRFGAIWERTEAEVSAVLTPEQQEKYKTILAERKQLFRGPPQGKKPPGPPKP